MENIIEYFKSNNLALICLKIIAVFIITKIIIKFLVGAVDKTVKIKSNKSPDMNKKYETLGNVAKSIIRYSAYFLCVVIQLTIIFGPIPLTFAGVGAAIVGFGTQNLVNDIISGFFILFESQYSIGDHVTILQNEGIVEAIELRVTRVRAFNGDLFIVPNGSITEVINHSNGPQRFEIFITVDYEADNALVEKIIADCCNDVNEYNSNIVEDAKLIGISEFTNFGSTYRIIGKCKPLTKIEIESYIRKYILNEFQKNKIEFGKMGFR